MNTNKPTENEALRTTPVQNPAEIEHVAGDVSKNGAVQRMQSQGMVELVGNQFRFKV